MAVILSMLSSTLNLGVRRTNNINDCKQLHDCRIKSYNMGWTTYPYMVVQENLKLN